MAALHDAVGTDPILQELAQTPLMLSIMSLAYQGVGDDELANLKGNSLEERRKQILRLYVEEMFRRKGANASTFSKEKIIGWLGKKMKEHSQSVFLVEGLQASWLGTRAERVAYGTVVAWNLWLLAGLLGGLLGGQHGWLGGQHGWLVLIGGSIVGLIVGLIFGLPILAGVGFGCWSETPLKNGAMSGSLVGLLVGLLGGLSGERSQVLSYELYGGWFSGSLFGLIYGLIVGLIGGLGVGTLNHITLVETISWNWNRFWKKTIPGSIVGLIFGLLLALVFILSYLNFLGRAGRVSPNFFVNFGLMVLLTFGLIFGFIFGLLSGLVGGFTDRVKVGKASPNQGIKLSGKNSLVVFVVTWLAVGLIGGLIGLLMRPLTKEVLYLALFDGLIVGLFVGIFVGLIGGLNRGGSAVIKHYALRLILWRSGYTPLNFIKFLDHCAKLILLKKVGGGYIFIHRMLLEYFADLIPQPARFEDGTTGPK